MLLSACGHSRGVLRLLHLKSGEWPKALVPAETVSTIARLRSYSVVILQPEMSDQIFATEMTQGVLELHQLNEDVVFGIEGGRGHG
jgi:hypothetical protein